MSIVIADIEFDYLDYDGRGDTLYLSVGPPRQTPPAAAMETREGHVVEYDASGNPIAMELLNVRWAIERDGFVTVTCPAEHRVGRATLQPALGG